ncbi:hypothetical protein [Sediminibacillus albus]|uniref:Uncharacterized protein n=1 Tax=Sediminibacillus albus TaxID=407036 RepID=A0A1G9A320_9BACI|nr:hypothetical protein [Sediminibacillus albus]SDK21244.1 hypothetical protein SAMN05216243_2357 [Sediminibacillus albus]
MTQEIIAGMPQTGAIVEEKNLIPQEKKELGLFVSWNGTTHWPVITLSFTNQNIGSLSRT